MLVQMVYTRRGSDDAHTVQRYHKGLMYDIAPSVAIAFIKEGAAESLESPLSFEETFEAIYGKRPS